MISKYGLFTYLIIACIAILIIVLAFLFQNNFLKNLFIVIGALIFAFTTYFFRDPERIPPKQKNCVVAPADGKIISIKTKRENKFLNCIAQQVSIFMSPFDVHVNRIPINGVIDYFNYVPGEYLVAFYDKADERNERTEIGIKNNLGKVLFTQVAGTIARRIVCNLKLGDSVKIGERFGMIKFGSRSDVIVDSTWKLMVKVGDKVKAGETILFEKIQNE
ncbi:phosphatidylserine decarboxylase family protein [Melioribacteraceae bacterium 4301-Me]|uniref:phosphatidylserine decarboxylase family protein n=1 Tax=Pyranulibacter aquaticus TaxID=3163344 RepID=UPI00359A5B7F